jgi:hypothetical protein
MRVLCVYYSLIRSHVIRYASPFRVLDAQFERAQPCQSCLSPRDQSRSSHSFDIELLINPERSFPEHIPQSLTAFRNDLVLSIISVS